MENGAAGARKGAAAMCWTFPPLAKVFRTGGGVTV